MKIPYNPAELRDDHGRWTKDETRDWLSRHPIDSKNIVDMYHKATSDEKTTGRVWYPESHTLAKALAQRDHTSVREAAGLMAAYSPQTAVGKNYTESSEVERTGTPIGGPGAHMSIVKTPADLQEKRVGVMAPATTAKRVKAILAGQDFEDVFAGGRNKSGKLKPSSLKIRAFGELIANGTQPDPEHPMVVIDRHAAGIARGVRMTDDDYNVANPSGSLKKFTEYSEAYKSAAKQLSKELGRDVSPEEVQATTWLTRRRLNGELDSQVGRTQQKLGRQDVKNAMNYFASYSPDGAEAMEDIFGKDGIAAAGLSKVHLKSDVDLAFNPAEHRDNKGRWTDGGMSTQDKYSLLGSATTVDELREAMKKATADGKTSSALTKAYTLKKTALSQGGLLTKTQRLAANPAPSRVRRSPKVADKAPKIEYGYDYMGKPKLVSVDDLIKQDANNRSIDEQGADPADATSVREERRAQYVAQAVASKYGMDTGVGKLWADYQRPNEYGKINAALRGKPGKKQAGYQKQADQMFNELGYNVQHPMKLYRALKSTPAIDAYPGSHDWSQELKPGVEFTDNGIISTSAQRHMAQGWLMGDEQGQDVDRENPNDVVLEINVKPGTRVVGGTTQFIETMLHPGTKLKVLSNEQKTETAVNPIDMTSKTFTYTHVVAEAQ